MLMEFAKRFFWGSGVLMWGLNCKCAPVSKHGSTSHVVQIPKAGDTLSSRHMNSCDVMCAVGMLETI